VIAIPIVVFALMPARGLANAGATLVGQTLGAQQPDRAEAAVRIATRFNAMFLGIVGAVFVILAYPLAGLFTSDPETLTYAARGLWIVSLAFPLYAAGMCFEGAFNGAGDTWTPTRLNFFCFWLGQVPLAWALANIAGLGALGVFISVPASFTVLALWSAVLFKRGKWKLLKRTCRHLDPNRPRHRYQLPFLRKHRRPRKPLAPIYLQRPTHRDTLVPWHHLSANRRSELAEHDSRPLARRPQCETARTIESRPQELRRCRRAERLIDDPRRGDGFGACRRPRKDAQTVARLAMRSADEAFRKRVLVEAVIVL
jgi:hypothetical protein